MSTEIALANGGIAIVDDADVALLQPRSRRRNAVQWRRNKWGYAVRSAGRGVEQMHRLILKPGPGFETDHRNGNRLDNRRKNLRRATTQQNRWNQVGRPAQRRSRFKGVIPWRPGGRDTGAWRAAIKLDNRTRVVGYFRDEETAARAYDAAARATFGEFARLNFPGDPPRTVAEIRQARALRGKRRRSRVWDA